MRDDAVLLQAQGLFDRGDYAACRRLLEERLASAPDDPALLRALALAVSRGGSLKESLRLLGRALEIAPDDAEAHFSRALLYLQYGNYRQGFLEYEWRLRRQSCIAWRYVQGALWDGGPLREGTLLLHCEQGLGDALQFIRYLPLVLERAQKVYLACHPALASLFRNLPGLAGVVTDGEPLPETTHHFPLLSLPRLFQTTLETIPSRFPYLPVPDVPPRAGATPRVGLIWKASAASPNGAYRSLAPADFMNWADIPVEWVLLQRDAPAEEMEAAAARFGSPALHFRDFQETAACVQGLDLVVSVDTSLVHLAGGLGKPAWVLLPRWGDWRWLQGRTDSPWYPGVTLFRQERDGDWSAPAARVAAALRGLI
ncbi:MAG: tetratricopeptide repeat-containing glycosyltransferase family protein [Verrucomicrobium sp.]|nr:tetratricopeptide repeat-containing glycosyltransferase family protein [Verrucomicrobium sp.]